MSRRKLTDAQAEQAVHLRETRRWATSRIARHFGVTVSCINYLLLVNGVDPWDPVKHPAKQKQKGGFSPEEDGRLMALRADGLSLERVAKTMSRPYTSVRIRLLTLEIRAEKALERAA